MKILTKQQHVNRVAEHWKSAYFKNGKWEYDGRDKIYDRIKKLGDNPCSKDIDKIIGNDSWTSMWCDNCDGGNDIIFSFCMDGYHHCSICDKCIDKIKSAMDAEKSKNENTNKR